jgi:hypothetical protein
MRMANSSAMFFARLTHSLLHVRCLLPRAQDYRKPEYLASIRHLVSAEWETGNQGIYNLLQHSYMIPPEIRYATLLRGLSDADEIQYRLAACVGVQFTSKAFLDAAPVTDRTFRTMLLDYAAAHEADDFLAARAFLAIKERLTHPRDTKFVLALMVR